jgi:DNA topoisomerase IB
VRLTQSDPAGSGFTRRRFGRGFAYYDVEGARITDPETLRRIEDLVLPPAWKQVWICPRPSGHIQATGVDGKGRRQYRYHDAWRVRRDREKFDHMITFARHLPAMRERLHDHLSGDQLDRQRVLACAARLLDEGFFRIGSEGYAEDNQTYGLATMLKRHARIDGDVVMFDYIAKGGKRRLQSVIDPDVRDVIAALKRRRSGGDALLAYRVAGRRRWVDVRSEEINEYLRDVTGIDCSAKDFRTWNATVLAAVALAVASGAGSATAKKRCVARAMQEVAHYLGNTPAVVRSSYVDPRVVDRYLAQDTIAAALEGLAWSDEAGSLLIQGDIEAAVLELIDADGAVSKAA